jgi:hypothetical protein
MYLKAAQAGAGLQSTGRDRAEPEGFHQANIGVGHHPRLRCVSLLNLRWIDSHKHCLHSTVTASAILLESPDSTAHINMKDVNNLPNVDTQPSGGLEMSLTIDEMDSLDDSA